MMGDVDAMKFLFFLHAEPSQGIESEEHDARRGQGPCAVHEHAVELVTQELGLATVEDSGKFLAGVIRMGHERSVEHADGTRGEVNGGCIEWVVNEKVILEKDNLQLASNGTQDTDENSCPGFDSIGGRACGDLFKN